MVGHQSKKLPRKEPRSESKGLHPRNRHQGHYDFKQLTKSCRELEMFLVINQYGDLSLDFADPKAVKMLNKALLNHFYGISNWEIPGNYLCPPIPGRADYLHHIADLLSTSNGGEIPRGESIRILDIGVGANCIYPLIGHCEYGWHFVGADVDSTALSFAKKIVESNEKLSDAIEFRLQTNPSHIFKGLLQGKDLFDISMCNPPFHTSLAEAREGSLRKWKNLGRGAAQVNDRSRGKEGVPILNRDRAPILNFGGQPAELWYPGGEGAFVCRMIEESVMFPLKVLWFSTLISKAATLPSIYSALKKVGATESKTIEMAQGQKKSRIVVWTFLSPKQRNEWKMKRWQTGSLLP